MREAVTVSREGEGTKREDTIERRGRMVVGTSIGSKEKISLYFGTEPTDIADRLPADKPPLAFILLAGEEEKSAGGELEDSRSANVEIFLGFAPSP